MSKYFYRIFTIIDLHFGAMQPCSSGLGMTLEASDFRSVRRLVAYSTLEYTITCYVYLIPVSILDGLKCSFTDSDGCNHFFYVQRTTILVENDRGIYISYTYTVMCIYI